MSRDAAWTAFDRTAAEAGKTRIVDQFAADPDRLARMSVQAAGLYLDLSKQSWTKAAFDACLDLARAWKQCDKSDLSEGLYIKAEADGKTLAWRTANLQETPEGPDYAALAAAQSRLVSRFAAQVAESLRTSGQ